MGPCRACERQPRNEGAALSYNADFGEVTRAAYQAVESIGLTVEEVAQLDPDTWYVIATGSTSVFSWGELVRVTVQRHGTTPVDVWILTRRRLALNVLATGDHSPEVIQRMNLVLRRRTPPPPLAASAGPAGGASTGRNDLSAP